MIVHTVYTVETMATLHESPLIELFFQVLLISKNCTKFGFSYNLLSLSSPPPLLGLSPTLLNYFFSKLFAFFKFVLEALAPRSMQATD